MPSPVIGAFAVNCVAASKRIQSAELSTPVNVASAVGIESGLAEVPSPLIGLFTFTLSNLPSNFCQSEVVKYPS